MSDLLEYIESYFQKQLSDTEEKEFTERCIHDKEFADEVAFYINFMEASREKLLDQKMQEWPADNKKANDIQPLVPLKKINFRKWLPYAAAACLVLAFIGYSLFTRESSSDLAHRYVQKNYAELSNSMSGSTDSIASGISAYNNKDYNKAIFIFKKVYNADPGNSDVKKYIGLSYLMLKDYDKALEQFDELAAKKIYSNPGLFLKAVTLLERNSKGDKEAARRLLEEVDAKQLEGNAEAHGWLGE